MTNPTNENKNANVGKPRFQLTTKSLGIAEAKAQDLAGYVLNQKDIVNATAKILMAVGIDKNDIREIKVGTDINSKKLRVICDIACAKKKNHNSDKEWFDFDNGSDNEYNGKSLLPQEFYSALHNKTYHGKRKHLNVQEVKIASKGEKPKKYIRFEFDAAILIAFVYDIVFTDPLYKVSAPPIRWKSNKDLDKEDYTNKQIKAYNRKKNEWMDLKLAPCAIYVTFRKNATYTDESGTVYTGFHPKQVDEYYGD